MVTARPPMRLPEPGSTWMAVTPPATARSIPGSWGQKASTVWGWGAGRRAWGAATLSWKAALLPGAPARSERRRRGPIAFEGGGHRLDDLGLVGDEARLAVLGERGVAQVLRAQIGPLPVDHDRL